MTLASRCETEPLSASVASSQSVNGKYYNPVVMNIIREDWIQQQLQQRQSSYTEFRPTRVVTGTWNVNAKKPLTPGESARIVHWVQPPSEEDPPDIVALGFQEIVDLNAVNVVVNSTLTVQRSSAWEEAVLAALNRHVGQRFEPKVGYRVVLEKHLVGILLLVFVRSDHWDHVREIKGATAGVGIMGVMGNKGGAAVRLKFYSSTLCFVCAHLAAHRENVAGRNADYLNILSKVQFGDNAEDGTPDMSGRFWSGEPSILNHDFVFWIGDLNYRIQDTLTTEEVFRLAESGRLLHELVQHDQLTIERLRGNVMKGFDEGPLTFPPTYKYQAGTSEYEKRPEKKLRAPAWCDRVLWRAKNPSDVKIRCYNSVPSLDVSDHKPVHASFDVQVKYQVESKKNDCIREIMMQLDKWENENMPKVKLLQEDATASNGVFSFSQLKFGVEQSKKVIIENTGLVVAHFRFIPKLEDVAVCKSWLNVAPMFGMIPPRDKMEIRITAMVDSAVAHGLTGGEETLDDTMILRVENGRDYFLVMSGQYANSCFGSSLEQLVSCPEPIRKAKFTASRSQAASIFSVWVGGATGVDANSLLSPQPTNSPPCLTTSTDSQKVPKELWRMVNDIYENYMQEKNLFVEAGSKVEIVQLREALDTGSAFPQHSGYSTAELLVRWLQALRQSVVPDEALAAAVASANGNMAQGCRALLDGLPPVRYNVVVYLVSFLREVLKHSAINKLTPEKLAFVFGRCLVAPCRLNAGKDLTNSNVGRVLALDEQQLANSNASSVSTVSSVGSNQSSILVPEERLRRNAHELEVAQASATQRAEKMERFLLHFLSVPMP
ncbi:Multiple inositol polyphosphate phosphatase [Phytophthora megakarya]|uniref:Multiple inositol polyphosphate phosphatase n=1 Tax=Phytophthora megakarya TaxID=4795 RepID=A0A225W7Z4_9STRA|nr:Multiple inositol polyphosphate phosphatase [Phytophthora megakarya]